MDLTPYVASIEDSLAAAAAAGDESTRRTAAALTAALEPAVRLALMNALADVALEVTDALGDQVVELRLEGGEVRIVTSRDTTTTAGSLDIADTGGEPSRITLRLPEGLKNQAEEAATGQGVSLNSWLIHAVQDALRGNTRPAVFDRARDVSGHRLRGWVQG
jgi:predicted HicB family RNase H-like nuclease